MPEPISIGGLDPAGTLTGAELVAVVQTGTTLRTTAGALAGLAAADLADDLSALDGRLDTLEGVNAGSRLTAIETARSSENAASRLTAIETARSSENAGSRLTAIEAVNAASRLTALEGLNAGSRLTAMERLGLRTSAVRSGGTNQSLGSVTAFTWSTLIFDVELDDDLNLWPSGNATRSSFAIADSGLYLVSGSAQVQSSAAGLVDCAVFVDGTIKNPTSRMPIVLSANGAAHVIAAPVLYQLNAGQVITLNVRCSVTSTLTILQGFGNFLQIVRVK